MSTTITGQSNYIMLCEYLMGDKGIAQYYYDYLGEISVETADSVQKGQQIGVFMLGSTNYDNPVVFFRIEQGGVAFDPYSF